MASITDAQKVMLNNCCISLSESELGSVIQELQDGDGIQTLTNKTIDGDLNTISDIATASLKTKTGADAAVVTGTAGTNGYVATWNGDGDLVDGTGQILGINVGSPTSYMEFDAATGLLTVGKASVGGDSPKGMLLGVEVLAGAGFRQGGLAMSVNRALGEDVTWDGNPDCGIKMTVYNRAVNAANEGAVRGIDIAARNRGTNVSWCNGISAGVRNDSGGTAYQLLGISTRLENYGTLETEAIGIDVNLSIENDTGAPTKTGILVRNTDASGMGAVDEVIKVSHTSTNGFTNLFNFAGATGDVIAAGSLSDSDSANIKCDAKIPVVWNGSTYYLAAYDTAI